MIRNDAADGESAEYRDSSWLLDVSPVVAVTVLLVGVYTLPTALQRELVFEYGTPTLATAYTAHFVHFSATHLVGNLAAFVLAAGTIYTLSVRADRRRIFFAFGATLLIAFPVTLSALNLAVPRNGVTYGFSGLNMALVGFLPVVIATYVERQLGYPVNGVVLLTAFFASVGYIAAIAVPQVPRSSALAAVTVTVAVSIARNYRRVQASRSVTGGRADGNWGIGTLIAVGFAVWAVLLSIGFPETVATGGTITNIYVHFLGYALGFTTAYIAYEWQLVCERPTPMPVSTSRRETKSD